MPGEYLFDSYQVNIGGVPTPWETSRERQREHADMVAPFKGMVAFTACPDGTLLASAFKRRCYHPDKETYQAEDSGSPSLYASDYAIDLKAGRIDVEPWKQLGGAGVGLAEAPDSLLVAVRQVEDGSAGEAGQRLTKRRAHAV